MPGDCMICWAMFGNGAPIGMTEKYYASSPSVAVDPPGPPKASDRVIRGGWLGRRAPLLSWEPTRSRKASTTRSWAVTRAVSGDRTTDRWKRFLADAVSFCNKMSEEDKRMPFYRINGTDVADVGGKATACLRRRMWNTPAGRGWPACSRGAMTLASKASMPV